MKIEATPDVVKRTRAYAEAFAAHPPAILPLFAAPGSGHGVPPGLAAASVKPPWFPFAADSDRGLGVLLLAAALHRPGGAAVGKSRPTGATAVPVDRAASVASRDATACEPGSGVGEEITLTGFGADAAVVIAGLYREYGQDVFRLNRLPFDPLRARVDALAGSWDEADRARIPGILRSVCDFFYRVGPLVSWLADGDWEQRTGELAQEIYWMGAQSPTRTKARLFFWLVCQIPGFAERPDMRAQALRFAGPVGEGHMRFLYDILMPRRALAASLRRPETRGDAFAEFSRFLFPEAPWRAYQPLDAFLRPDGAGGFRCRGVQGGCRPCPLAPLCPAAKNFLPGERPENPRGIPQG